MARSMVPGVQVGEQGLLQHHLHDEESILVFAGGIIPEQDISGLKSAGIDEIFLPGTSTKAIVEYLQGRFAAVAAS